MTIFMVFFITLIFLKMLSANISEIKANFSYYVNLAIKKGEPVIICNHNVPIAEIKPMTETKTNKRKLGVCKDKIILPDDFNETSQEIIDEFYADNIFPKTTKKKPKKTSKK